MSALSQMPMREGERWRPFEVTLIWTWRHTTRILHWTQQMPVCQVANRKMQQEAPTLNYERKSWLLSYFASIPSPGRITRCGHTHGCNPAARWALFLQGRKNWRTESMTSTGRAMQNLWRSGKFCFYRHYLNWKDLCTSLNWPFQWYSSILVK